MAAKRLLQLALLPVAATTAEGLSSLDDEVALVQQPLFVRHMLRDSGILPMKHRPVLWLHLPKAGGLAMCELSKANGEKFMYSTDQRSCNWQPYDDSRAEAEVSTRMPTCTDRSETWFASGFSWSQIERPLRKEDLCGDQFLYGTMLRNPVELVKSLIGSYVPNSTPPGQDPTSILNCLEAVKTGYNASCASTSLPPSKNAYWKYFDNPMVRMLAGPEVWALPPAGVNTTHRELAIQRLNDFDLTLLLEYLGQNQTKEDLRKAFGWRNMGAIDAQVNRQSFVAVPLTPFNSLRIQRVNEHDMMLYNVFKGLEDFNKAPRSQVIQGFLWNT